MRFPGQRYDAATGMNYNYFRDYDPASGRYIESDPIGLEAGPTTYGYGNLSPLAHVDEDGLIAGHILRGFAKRARLGKNSFKRLPKKKISRTILLTAGAKLAIKKNLARATAEQTRLRAQRACRERLAKMGLDLDELLGAATKMDRKGLTRAGRSLDKHSNIQRGKETPFPRLSGGPKERNSMGKFQVEDMLINPNASFRRLGRGGLEVRVPDGRAMRFDADGRFAGFID